MQSRFLQITASKTAQPLPQTLSLEDFPPLDVTPFDLLKKVCKERNINVKGVRSRNEISKRICEFVESTKRPTGIHDQLNHQVAKIYEGLDKIADLCPDLSLNFPQVVVVGDESTGKSSLIERIAMFSFFPRGNDSGQRSLCTTMPIHLRLKHLSENALQAFVAENKLKYTEKNCFWVRLHYEPKHGVAEYSPFFNKDQVEKNVKLYMNELWNKTNGTFLTGDILTCLGKTGVSSDCLVIEVFSNQVPNLTLVDLPGIVHVPRPNEPTNMPQLTEEITRDYITRDHTLILAVLRANDAQRSSKALALIKEHKKENIALGVLTMCDLVRGNKRLTKDFLLRLQNNAPDSISLHHGYIGIKNRDTREEEDSEDVPSLEAAAEEELEWFEEYFPDVPPNSVTTPVLLSRLVKMIINYTKETWVPDTLQKIQQQKNLLSHKASAMGLPDPKNISDKAKSNLVLTLCTHVTKIQLNFALAELQELFKIPQYTNTPRYLSDAENWMVWKKQCLMQVEEGFKAIPLFVAEKRVLALSCSDSPLIPSRFVKFKERVSACLTDMMVMSMSACQKRFAEDSKLLLVTGDWNYSCRSMLHEMIKTLATTIAYEEMVHPVISTSPDTLVSAVVRCLDGLDALLEEVESDARAELSKRINALELTEKQILLMCSEV